MRIAYIAPYQGPALLKTRPSERNLGLAANLKIELVAELLQASGNSVEILSQGEVVERRFKFYPAFSETNPYNANIRIRYASAFPIKFLNAVWPSFRTRALFKRCHRATPYDLVIIYNLKLPQLVCARHAIQKLGLPVILEYEDDAFVDVVGKNAKELGIYYSWARNILRTANGCLGVSPHLLSYFPSSTPRFLLRGIVGDEYLDLNEGERIERKDRVVYSGTHYRSKGLEPLITAWKTLDLPGWELHIAGHGELTAKLEKMAESHKNIIFHGLVNRKQNAQLLRSAKIGINPHEVSQTPGNVFAFKIIEYLASGLHVITTPMGALEPELESGITYMSDNSPGTIATTLSRVIQNREHGRTAAKAALDTYGPKAVASGLSKLIKDVSQRKACERRESKA